MSINPSTPWHKASYDQFISDRLPQLLAERLPLAGYSAAEDGPNTCCLQIELTGGAQARYPAIPRPDESGVFQINGTPCVVIPLVSPAALDVAEVACVGEQLFAFIQERLGQASNGVTWENELLRAWLPIDRWVNEFVAAKAQHLDTTNWLSRQTHLRRIAIPARDKVVAPEEQGRVCPFETPEGPNIGRIFTVAIGAEIRAGRLIVTEAHPEAGLGLSASMLPFLENNDPNRLLMAANMLRQAIVPTQPEPAWVQTGNEPDAPGVWCGRNLLTAFVSWGPGTSEDGIILSESAARRMDDPFPVEPGDKLANRHGSKGVISYILPDDQMPHLPDGTPVELVYNFPGLRTRMHLGQVREAALSRIARIEGTPAIVPPYRAPTPDELRQRLILAGLPETGMETLTQGKDGPALERPSAVGWVYWNRLAHLAKDKLKITLDHIESADSPGQLLGEMQFNVLKELGATATLHEALNARSTRNPQGAAGAPASPPMFSDLVRRLQVAGIQAELQDGRLAFRFVPPEGEALKLARPQPHPWLSERLLDAVGTISAVEGASLPVDEFNRLAEANRHLGRILSSQAPERLAREAEAHLQAALNAFFAVLLPPEILRFKERQLFSGRAVIAPGVRLRFDQIGFPETLCWKLFGSQVAAELKDGTPVGPENLRAVRALDAALARAWVTVHPFLTFSSTALLAFHPVRDPGRVIRLNPILCRWMNADFDGDQVAFYLPLTAAAQQEAGELLSVAGQLTHNPSLAKTLLLPPEALWGLAWRSLTAAGRSEIARIAGGPEHALEPVLTQATLTDLLGAILERDGAARMLETFQSLAQVGFEAARASGASMSPFIRMDGAMPPTPEGDDPDRWGIYTEELTEKILSSTNYQDIHIGPQLLDARVRPWAKRTMHMVVGVRGVVTDAAGKPFVVRRNYAQGLTPEEMYACVAGARQGFAQLNVQNDQMIQEALSHDDDASLSVLARARRAKHPGIVFARAAASGEIDRLEDVASRLMVGVS
jgi:hypothetical protein